MANEDIPAPLGKLRRDAARKAYSEEELIKAPTPREAWNLDRLVEAPAGMEGQLRSHGPDWAMFGSEEDPPRLGMGSRLQQVPGHEVTGFHEQERAEDPRIKSLGVTDGHRSHAIAKHR